MTITISLSINSAAAQTIQTGASTIGQLISERVGFGQTVTAKINGAPASLAALIHHADTVQLTTVAAAQAPAPQTTPVAGLIEVSYINNDGAGFADRLTIQAGLTIGALIRQKGIDVTRFSIRVNGNIVTAETQLNRGDKISVTPIKIEGAAGAEEIEILYVNNNGSGFADKVTAIRGITLRQFFAQRTESADPARYVIRVNGQPATQDQQLNSGDKISVTPLKIQGAKA